jgi:DegV family protein with EDD domain
MTVKIVTDSTSDLPLQVAQELGITVVPLYVRFGADVYRDGVDLTTKEFYRKLVSSRKLPTTSAPSPGEVAEVYDKVAEGTDEILSIHLSSKFSALYEVALRAKEQMKKKCQVEVIDSLSGIMGEGLIVIAAAKEAQAGASLAQVIDTVGKTIPKSHVRW